MSLPIVRSIGCARRSVASTAALTVLLVGHAARADALDFGYSTGCYASAVDSSGDWSTVDAFAQRGPLHVTLSTGDSAFNRQSCARTEAGVLLQYRDASETRVSAFARFEVTPLHSVGVGLDVLSYVETPGSAPSTGLGNLTLASTQDLWLTVFGSQLALTTRFLLPTSTLRGRAGGEIGLAGSTITRGLGWLEWHGYLGADLLAPAGIVEAEPPPIETAAIGIAGTQIYPYGRWYSFVIDVHARAGTASSRVVPMTGMRLQLGGLGVELAGGYVFSTSKSDEGPTFTLRVAYLPHP